MNDRIKVFVVDDHPLVRRGVTVCLGRDREVEVVGESGDAHEVLPLTHELQPDVIVMDMGMPDMSGTEIIALLRRELPHIRILVLSIQEEPDYARQAMQTGAHGYILKGVACADLICAVKTVYRGEFYFNPELMQSFREQSLGKEKDDASKLTEREREVLVQIAEGFSNKEIAGKLGIAVRTVESHRENLMRKLEIRSAAGLTRFAVARPLVPASPENAGFVPVVSV